MFKIRFNSLYVASMDFILDEKNNQEFSDPSSEINHYKSVVDRYNELLFNFDNIKSQLEDDSTLHTEIDEILFTLNESFDKYREKSAIVRSYIHELEILDEKITFSNRLYRYEQSLIADPLIKVDVEELQEILVFAKEYVKNISEFYYFTNNPFNMDEDLNLIIPEKKIFDSSEKLLTSVYNYMYGLFITYKDINSDELILMESLEKSIENKIYNLVDLYNRQKKNKFIVTPETTDNEYYEAIENIKSMFKDYYNDIIDSGVYRFTSISKLFESAYDEISDFISEYESHSLYMDYEKSVEFDILIDKLGSYVTLLEDGKIKPDVKYIITDTTLKDVVDQIISMARNVKKNIFYTQKYHKSGTPIYLEFKFYQTSTFLSSIKEYYYDLMRENIYRYSKLGIDDYGDDSVSDIREQYKHELIDYRQFIEQDVGYLNDFEFTEYCQNVVNIQNRLKKTGLMFFDSAKKTSPVTYISDMEDNYLTFINQLNKDLKDIRGRRIVNILVITDENKLEAKKKLMYVSDRCSQIESIKDVASKYVFLGLSEYVHQYLYAPFNDFLDVLTDYYNKEEYIELLNYYEHTYSQNIINFNLLYSFEKIKESTETIFGKIDDIDSMYIEEYAQDAVTYNFPNSVYVLNDLFDDETYVVMRNEIFSELDVMYEFVISTRPNEKTFLINDKNLKKLYFDNQLMKISYIRWHHIILEEFEYYKSIDASLIEHIESYQSKKELIENFIHKDKLTTMIMSQNTTLTELTKMINEYASDTNYNSINLSSEIIRYIDEYNLIVSDDFEDYSNTIHKLKKFEMIETINNKKKELDQKHLSQWIHVIVSNDIDDPEKISYTDMDTITGNIPFTVELKAKQEIDISVDGEEINATYKWYIGSTVKEGSEVAYTFYESGLHKIRCEISYSSGETRSMFLEFDLGGPQNAQIVKIGRESYSPLEEQTDTPKLTFKDSETGTITTIPLYISGNILDMVGEGVINVTDPGSELDRDRIGMVILGFRGMEFPGEEFNNSEIFNEDFEMPEEAEFLFDFRVSTPISGTSTIDIASSEYITFMAKLPRSIESPYEIEKASLFDPIGTNVSIDIGDMLVFRNKWDRYAIVKVDSIESFTERADEAEDGVGKYYYSVDFTYFVNTSLNQYDRDEFMPEATNVVVPTLIFKSNVKELFNSLIVRLEKINLLRDELDDSLDKESYETILTEINALEEENRGFYLFEELDKMKAKYYSLKQLHTDMSEDFYMNFNMSNEELMTIVEKYRKHVDNTKSFETYINDINAYDFKQNLIDLGILVDLYKDQQTIMEILIKTYEYKKYDTTYYFEQLKNIKLFDTTDFINRRLSYGEMLVQLVTKLRTILFKIKIVINYPIMSEGTHIVMSDIYSRLKQNLSTGVWTDEPESDLFLLNKKLELQYGYEIEKVESGQPYKDFISELVSCEKDLFGKGLTSDDIGDISNYIQVVESKSVEQYDDFFMIPFWIDYLQKNV